MMCHPEIGYQPLHPKRKEPPTRGFGGSYVLKQDIARPEGLEPPTAWFEARNSIQLSYGRMRRMAEAKG